MQTNNSHLIIRDHWRNFWGL